MRSLAVLLLLVPISVPPVMAQDEAETPFFLPTPDGWRTETIALPLEFAPEIEVRLAAVEGAPFGRMQWEGVASTYDAFATRESLRLDVRIDLVRCPAQDRLAVFFRLSPQPSGHEIWETLAEIRNGFRCSS